MIRFGLRLMQQSWRLNRLSRGEKLPPASRRSRGGRVGPGERVANNALHEFPSNHAQQKPCVAGIARPQSGRLEPHPVRPLQTQLLEPTRSALDAAGNEVERRPDLD